MSMTASKRAFHFKERRESFITSGVTIMRCYFMRGGHIEAVEELPGMADEDAIAKAHALFSERKHLFEGFELWERARVLIRHPAPVASKSPGVWPLHRDLTRLAASGRSMDGSYKPSAPRKPSLKA
jgi:hypothetical protein